MDAALHRIEALPGDGRYAVTFRYADGTEVAAVVQLADRVQVADASLPAGWTAHGPLVQHADRCVCTECSAAAAMS